MAHKNVIIMYKISNTNVAEAQMTKWRILMAIKNEHGPDNTNDHSVHGKCPKEP